MSRIACLTALMFIAAAAAGPAMAQVATPAPPAPSGSAAPQATPQGSTEQQAKSGVIRPPAEVDPAMKRAAPPPSQAFPMPVVRPPGTPGGNPNVIAK